MFAPLLLLSLTLTVQDASASRAQRADRSRPARASSSVTIDVSALVQAAGATLDHVGARLEGLGPQLQSLGPQLEAIGPRLHGLGPQLEAAGARLGASLGRLRGMDFDQFDRDDRDEQFEDAQQQDSLYRAATRALNRGEYREAADLFRRYVDRNPRGESVANAMYFRAYALSRTGRSSDLRSALSALDDLNERFPDHRDAGSLRVRVCGELARMGDEACARSVAEAASPRSSDQSSGQQPRCPRDDDESDERIMALNALISMDSERAIPILENVLSRRDECSVALRRKAVFLVSTKRHERSFDILSRAARQDPDREVREQAVFWLGQTRDDRVLDFLSSVVENDRDVELQKKAVFALSQHRSDRAAELLRNLASRDATPREVRLDAIFWLGQHRGTQSVQFLRDLFARSRDREVKDKILHAVTQQRGTDAGEWLLSVATSSNEEVEIRKQALFWAGQMRAVTMEQLTNLYARSDDREMKEQLIFVYSQRREREAVDKLMDIARSDRDRELRSKAIFWLGQRRGDPRIDQFLLEIINK
jgi:HEAT repeat protein